MACIAIATVLSAVAILLLIIEVGDQRHGTECRYDISAEVNSISDRIDAHVARGLVALAREDEADFLSQANEISTLVESLDPAIERRTNARERCS